MEAEPQGLKEAHAEARRVAEAAAVELAAKRGMCEEASAAAREAEARHREAELASAVTVESCAKLHAERAAFAGLVEGPFPVLVAGGWKNDQEKSAALDAVTASLLDKVLVAAAKATLGTRPECRKAFDTLTVGAVEATLARRLAALDTELAKVAPIEAQARTEVLGLWAIADCARDEAARLTVGLHAAQRAQKAADAAVARAHEKMLEQVLVLGEAAQRLRVDAHSQGMDTALPAMEELVTAWAGQGGPGGGGDVEMTNDVGVSAPDAGVAN